MPLRPVAGEVGVGRVEGGEDGGRNVVLAARAEPVIAVAEAPVRHELPHRLGIAAALAGIQLAQRRTAGTGGCRHARGAGQVAVFRPPEQFRLELQVAVSGVALGRPFPDEVGNPGAAAAGEQPLDLVRAGRVGVLEMGFAVLCPRRQPRQSGTPGMRAADVAADVCKQAGRADAVLVAVGAGEILAAADLGAELHEQVGRRHPLQLQAVLAVVFAEQRLRHQRRVGEVPGVRMLLVEVADAGEEAAALQREALAQAEGLEPRLLDLGLAVLQRHVEHAAKIGTDVGGDDQLGAVHRKSAFIAAVIMAAGRPVAADGTLRHVLHAAILPLQDERHLRIEAAGRAGARAAVLRRLTLFLRRPGCRQPLLQRLDALLVGFLHLRDFLAQGFQVFVAGGGRQGQRCRNGKQCDAKHEILQSKRNGHRPTGGGGIDNRASENGGRGARIVAPYRGG